jgi:cytoskeletal protein CcmA (bactofilin family)
MAATAAKPTALGEITSLLGRGSAFEGKLTFEGTVRIDGRFRGEVFSDDTLVIGEGALVEAEIDIGDIIIQGTVVGNIKAKRSIEIHAPGRVKGDLHSPSLQIDKGVIFEGRCFMEGVAEKLQHHGAGMGQPKRSGEIVIDAALPPQQPKQPPPPAKSPVTGAK